MPVCGIEELLIARLCFAVNLAILDVCAVDQTHQFSVVERPEISQPILCQA